ncbi:hypothetical protein V490_07931 [Pseudogymnoascus sp. VKM F-3557]|nr:hypothetical protein V490_07931 [Pseudogymnoascus sp. VKM F-3557]
MLSAPRVLARRDIMAILSSPNQTHISSRQLKQFATGKKEPYHAPEVDRACGVPQSAPEAGPKSVGGIMGPELWLLGFGTAIGLAAFVVLAPNSGTKTGDAMQKHIRDERESLERRRGDTEEEETPRMRDLELAEIEYAKREKAQKESSRKP